MSDYETEHKVIIKGVHYANVLIEFDEKFFTIELIAPPDSIEGVMAITKAGLKTLEKLGYKAKI